MIPHPFSPNDNACSGFDTARDARSGRRLPARGIGGQGRGHCGTDVQVGRHPGTLEFHSTLPPKLLVMLFRFFNVGSSIDFVAEITCRFATILELTCSIV